MADISKITLPNGDSYDIKDATARKGQAIYYATCSTAAGTAAKVATTTDGDFTLETGAMVRVKFTNADTYNGTSTLNVDSKGAKNIVNVGTTAKARYHWVAGEVVDFVYDGTNFTMSDTGVATTTYYGITKLSSATNSTSTALAATASAVKAAYDLANAAAPQSTTYTKTEVDNLIGEAVDFGTVGSNQNPVYFNNGDPTPIAFTFGVDDDQNVQVAWDGDAPEIVIPTTSALAISSGGTGATTAAGARTNLGLGSAATYSVVSSVQDDENLVTNGAVYRYVNGKIEDELNGTVVAVYNHTANRTFYGTCSTAAATAAKVVELEDGDGFELKPGVVVGVKFSATNTASNMTLNVNNTGAIGISYVAGTRYTGSTANITGSVSYVFYYMYDGTYWTFFNHSGNYSNNSNTVPSAQCETAAATAAKTATLTNHTLTANTYCHFNIRYANTAKSALTMNVDSSGAKPIYINDVVSSASNYTLPAGTYIAFYNGTNWYFRTDEKLPASISGTAANVRGCVLVGNGGTGATTASAARTNLGLAERSYSTETLATFYANVLADGYEIFVGTTDMTSKLTSSKASGVCFGFATHNAAQAFVEGLLYNASSGKIFTYRVASDGTVSLVKNVALTTA